MQIVQCLLRTEGCTMFCWLRGEERIKVDSMIRLDEDYRTWTIETVSPPQDYHTVQEITK
jgi:hypothetical protein